MGTSSIIADISESLLAYLKANLTGLVESDHVTLKSPADRGTDIKPSLDVFLYHVAENLDVVNQPPARPTPATQKPPPFMVDLYYVVVPYAKTQTVEQQILGKVIQIFASNPVLRGSFVKKSMAESHQEIRIVVHRQNLEEMFRLWNNLSNAQYKPSVSYKVAGVSIDLTKELFPAVPVAERVLDWEEIT